jgi:hypothetical protein
MFEGAKVRLGEKFYFVPALTLKDVRLLGEKIQSLRSGIALGGDEKRDTLIEVIHTAMQHNYPEMSREYLEGIITLRNINELVTAVMGQSGLYESGEAEAGSQ